MLNLTYGQKLALSQNDDFLRVVLQWNTSLYEGNHDLEIDLVAFILRDGARVESKNDFIFYHNTMTANASVVLNASASDSAEIKINFSKLDANINRIVLAGAIYNYEERNQFFTDVTALKARIYQGNKLVACYSLDKSSFDCETAIVFVEVYKYMGNWRLITENSAYLNGLNGLCRNYGLESPLSKRTIEIKSPIIDESASDSKEYISYMSDADLIYYMDELIKTCQRLENYLMRSQSKVVHLTSSRPEFFEYFILAPALFLSQNISLEREIKNKLLKKILVYSKGFSGVEVIEKDDLLKLVDDSSNFLDFIEVTNLDSNLAVSSLYSILIESICKLFLLASKDLKASEVQLYKQIADKLASYNLAKDILFLNNLYQSHAIKIIDDWYKRYIDSGFAIEDDVYDLNDLLNQLNALTGLSAVKDDINSLINMVKIQKIRQERQLPTATLSLHLVFSGNPGTGKTTVARLLAKIYKAIGILSKGHLVEVDRSQLVAGYVGQTAINVREIVESALGGVLFIDEAYSLAGNKQGQDFGQEAIDTLLKAMEDKRDQFIVIVAGYQREMQRFIHSNPGLESRFNKYIYFEDYRPQELVNIFEGMCNKSNLVLTHNAQLYVSNYFHERYQNRSENYANARDVRNFYEKMLVLQANRIAVKADISDEDLTQIQYDDVVGVKL